jgi:hypothetical protein
MKKIIDGKVYNTETADSIGIYWNGYAQSDFHYEELTLYKTKKGSFFVAGESGPLGCFAKSVGNGFTGGEGLFTLTREEALEWAERHLDPEDYEEYFSDLIEEA